MKYINWWEFVQKVNEHIKQMKIDPTQIKIHYIDICYPNTLNIEIDTSNDNELRITQDNL